MESEYSKASEETKPQVSWAQFSDLLPEFPAEKETIHQRLNEVQPLHKMLHPTECTLGQTSLNMLVKSKWKDFLCRISTKNNA